MTRNDAKKAKNGELDNLALSGAKMKKKRENFLQKVSWFER